jgi:Ca-activated chloride channel homolog
VWEFVSFEPLVWLLAIVLLAVVATRFSLVDRPAWMQWASFGFRAGAIFFLILALCRPFAKQENERLHVSFLVDVSQSVDLDAAIASLGQVENAVGQLRTDDSWTLFAVGNGVRQFGTTEELRTLLTEWKSGIADDEFRRATKLADALLSTRLVFPSDKSRRTVLLSDGQETDQDIAAVLKQLADEGIDTRYVPIAGLATPEAAVVSLEPTSRDAFYGEVMRMTVKLAANRPIAGKLRLIQKGVVVQQQDVLLAGGKTTTAHFDVDMTTPGASLWSVELVPEDDHFPINNIAACTVNVRGRPRVLVLHQKPQELRSFARMLEEQDITAEVRGQYGLPETLAEMASFDAIILADLPATSLSARQMQMVKHYVLDLGGGLVMMGSENSFGLGG